MTHSKVAMLLLLLSILARATAPSVPKLLPNNLRRKGEFESQRNSALVRRNVQGAGAVQTRREQPTVES